MNYEEKKQKCISEHRCPNCYRKHKEKYTYCKKCREWRHDRYGNRKCKDCGKALKYGYSFYRCPKCRKGKDNPTDYMRIWRKENPQKYQDATLKRRYGISYIIFQDLYKEQNGKCAICKNDIPFIDSPNKNRNKLAHVDHDHKTNKVRGLLCPNCNLMLGYSKDNISILTDAIKYLQNNS